MFFMFDIIAGIVLAHTVGYFFGFEPSMLHVLIGIVCALLPDLDFLYHYFKTSEVSAYKGHTRDHREGLHYPLLYIPIGGMCVWVLFGDVWAVLFILGSLSHFLHDSAGIGWGIKWLFPLTANNYKFFCEKDGTLSKRLVVFWTPQELESIITAKGDKDWIRNLFWDPLKEKRFNWLLCMEFFVPLLLIIGYVIWRVW